MNLDIVNGAFELVGSVMIWGNVHALYRDKSVKGVTPWATMFFFTWGLFNLAYYPSLHQWFSFAGGISIALANLFWLGLAMKYRRRAVPAAEELDWAEYQWTQCGFAYNPDTGVWEWYEKKTPARA
jgi:hypothetical protein